MKEIPVGYIVAKLVPPKGFIIPDGRSIEETGSSLYENFLECDGAIKLRSEFSELFEVIGETFGAGDGKTTFQLPDFRIDDPLVKHYIKYK